DRNEEVRDLVSQTPRSAFARTQSPQRLDRDSRCGHGKCFAREHLPWTVKSRTPCDSCCPDDQAGHGVRLRRRNRFCPRERKRRIPWLRWSTALSALILLRVRL